MNEPQVEVQRFEVDDPDDQKIVFMTKMEHAETGEVEEVTITVEGFKDPSAGVAATMKFAQSLFERYISGEFACTCPDHDHGDSSRDPAVDRIDAALERLLRMDD